MKRFLVAADDALKSAAEAGNNRSERADNKFREAFRQFSTRMMFYIISDPNYMAIRSLLQWDLHARVRFPSVCFSTSQLES